jgi:hypothetical protein
MTQDAHEFEATVVDEDANGRRTGEIIVHLAVQSLRRPATFTWAVGEAGARSYHNAVASAPRMNWGRAYSTARH